jgi:hypothetical protein
MADNRNGDPSWNIYQNLVEAGVPASEIPRMMAEAEKGNAIVFQSAMDSNAGPTDRKSDRYRPYVDVNTGDIIPPQYSTETAAVSNRLTPNTFGYGVDGSVTGVAENPAVKVAEALASGNKVSNIGYTNARIAAALSSLGKASTPAAYRPYVAAPRPTPLLASRPQVQPDTGYFGVPMSPGMSRNQVGRAVLSGIPGVGAAAQRPALNKTQQALAAVAQAASAPAVAPPTQSTASQESKFQWTDNTYLPSSIANDPRWR